ncbi:MAPEG family protein [Nannocystis punicea]|uniref:MAPEG family protein n=1 Tax=Nannocystis punicea TaxID=2995304 RepID=A0ABY7GVW2_9BACT|nr:MAPEG family protein [Nannocystis poenicansa]WAS91092.1 MAPEG family protein [Nannocystis poenicansa]
MVTETPVFAVLLLLLVTLLGVNTSITRMRLRIADGDGGDKRMTRAIRAHANALEHVLPFVLLLYFYEQSGGCAATIRWAGGLFLAARVGHAVSMLRGPFDLRRLSATLTIALEVWLSLALLRNLL